MTMQKATLKTRLAAAALLSLATALPAALPAQAQGFSLFDLFKGGDAPTTTTERAPRGGNAAAPYRGQVNLQRLKADLARNGFRLGQPVFVRIIKDERVVELWFQSPDGRMRKYRDFKIRAMSGTLGPKRYEGDMQAAEGFYTVGRGQMNPGSSYQASFNVGYPNAFDRAQPRVMNTSTRRARSLGGLIMVHGADNMDGIYKSVGCFAIEDVHDLYTITDHALRGGQNNFSVHAFPFRMTERAMRRHAGSQHIAFWRQLQPGFQAFEETQRVPAISVSDGRYVMRGQSVPEIKREEAPVIAAVPVPEAAPRRRAEAQTTVIPRISPRLAMFSAAFAPVALSAEQRRAWRGVYVCPTSEGYVMRRIDTGTAPAGCKAFIQ